jgi:hypothetical protein
MTSGALCFTMTAARLVRLSMFLTTLLLLSGYRALFTSADDRLAPTILVFPALVKRTTSRSRNVATMLLQKRGSPLCDARRRLRIDFLYESLDILA